MKKFLSLAFAAGLLSSCGTMESMFDFKVHEGTVAPVHVNLEDTQIRYNNVSILDQSLKNKIAVENSNWQRTVTDNVEVWTTLRNRTDYPQQLEIRVQFYDANTVPLGQPSAWQKFFLSPNAIKAWKETSTFENVHSYFIEVREGR